MHPQTGAGATFWSSPFRHSALPGNTTMNLPLDAHGFNSYGFLMSMYWMALDTGSLDLGLLPRQVAIHDDRLAAMLDKIDEAFVEREGLHVSEEMIARTRRMLDDVLASLP